MTKKGFHEDERVMLKKLLKAKNIIFEFVLNIFNYRYYCDKIK